MAPINGPWRCPKRNGVQERELGANIYSIYRPRKRRMGVCATRDVEFSDTRLESFLCEERQS